MRQLTAIVAVMFMAAGVSAFIAEGRTAATLQSTPPSTPRPGHERLAVLEGTWAKKDLPTGETFRDTCAWLPEGRRHMICRQRGESLRGATEQMAIFSYRGADSTYLLTVFLANGQVWRYEGRPDADRWVFDLVPSRPDSPRLRQVLIPAGDSIRFLEEVSENGGPWRLSDPSEDFTYVRVGGHQGRSSILDLLVWGAQMNVDLSDYPPDVRADAEAVIARSKAYQSKRAQPTESDGLSRMVHQARVTYERRLVAMARTPGAEAAALAYVTDLAPCYEWEGYSDCPAREASFASEYQRTQPGAPFSDLLPLLEAHRWLCAAEGFDYEKNAEGAASARARSGASLKAAAASGDRLVRIGAAELEARATCIRASRE